MTTLTDRREQAHQTDLTRTGEMAALISRLDSTLQWLRVIVEHNIDLADTARTAMLDKINEAVGRTAEWRAERDARIDQILGGDGDAD